MFDSHTRTIVVVGAQWGDEGKGKLVDVLAERADWVVRYQGGANAGHTVHIGDKSFVLHQIPSGILHPGVRCAIGNGVVLDVETLFAEIDELVSDGIDVEGRLYVSDRAHLVLPYHKGGSGHVPVSPHSHDCFHLIVFADRGVLVGAVAHILDLAIRPEDAPV